MNTIGLLLLGELDPTGFLFQATQTRMHYSFSPEQIQADPFCIEHGLVQWPCMFQTLLVVFNSGVGQGKEMEMIKGWMLSLCEKWIGLLQLVTCTLYVQITIAR